MQNGVFARFGYAFDPKNTAKPSENVILRGETTYFMVLLFVFSLIFLFLKPPGRSGRPQGAPGGPEEPPNAPGGPNWDLPGALLGPPESSWSAPGAPRGTEGTPGGASGSLLALSWGFLEPRDLILDPFLPSGKALCFGVLRHRNRNRNRLLVFSFGSFKSRVLGFSSGVLGFSSGVFGFSSGPVHGL